MAVLPMARVSIYGLKRDRKKILEAVQKLGVVDVRDFESENLEVEKIDTSVTQAKFNKVRADIVAALELLNKYCPEKKPMLGFLNGLEEMPDDEWNELIDKKESILKTVERILSLDKRNSDLQGEIIKNKNNIAALMPWLKLNIPFKFKGTKKTTAFLGSFPQGDNVEEIVSEFNRLCDERKFDTLKDKIYVEIISTGDTQTNVVVICNKDLAPKTEDVLRQMGFAAAVAVCDGIPKDKIGEFEDAILQAEKEIEINKNEIISFESERRNLKFAFDYFSGRIEKYKVIEQLGQSKRTFALTGYIPSKDVPKVEDILTHKYSAAFEIEQAEGEDVPVLLDNGGFSAPLEGVLETFSLPGKGEIDPTTVMAVFYYFLFGLMLSDAAYGILMVLICGLALKFFPNMKEGMKKSLKMYLYCGISTTFWGAMFGGYFGDAIQVIAATFFNKEIVIEPLWFSPLNEPMRMLMFSFAVGIVHLFAGLGMRFYSLVKEKKYFDAIYDVIFWYLLVGGAIVFLMSTQMFVDMSGLGFIVPSLGGRIATFAAIIGAVGIALTAGRSSRNPFKRLAKGLYELYNVTGYLSDILSYSRLLALGLATGVIANVFNKMGSMFGSGVLGVIGFTLVFIIGHTLNIGINLLGAYVHTNRLQFVEFFGKFYEGGGVKYNPFKADTEYFKRENN